MIFPYQIGNIPLFRYLVGTDDPVQFSLDQKWDVPAIRFSDSGGSLYTGPSNRSLMQAVTAKIEGTVQAKSYALAQELLTALQSLSGRLAVPLIGFRYEQSFLPSVASQMDWLVADAVISSKSQAMPYSGEDQANAGYIRLRLNLEVTLMTPLRRMYPWFWEYRSFQDRVQNPYVADGASSGSLLFTHPRLFSDIRDEYYFVRWLDKDTLSDPDFWELASNDGAGQGMEFSEVYEVFYHSDPMRWSSPPQVVYAFTNLLPYGDLTITVQRSTGFSHGDDYEETSSIDLSALDTALALKGYGGLFNSDILYVGDIYPFPSYVLRNSEILEALVPEWAYSGLYPGELQTGPATIQFAASLSSLSVAYNFVYGVF